MLSDFHLHTDFSGDCNASPALQIEKAISMGMKRLCITDHHDYDVFSQYEFTLDFPVYLSVMKELRNTYKNQIQLEIGVELGLQCHITEYLKRLISVYSFDFIIGSSHFVDGMDPYYPAFYENRTGKEACARYFEATWNRVKDIDCFDSLGHLDYVVRYAPGRTQDYHWKDYQEWIDPILKTLIERGKGLECNTGGFRCRLGGPNPCEGILRRYRELGGELITLGSDAHTPGQVGASFDLAAELLKACGFRYYTVYHERKPQFLNL